MLFLDYLESYVDLHIEEVKTKIHLMAGMDVKNESKKLSSVSSAILLLFEDK